MGCPPASGADLCRRCPHRAPSSCGFQRGCSLFLAADSLQACEGRTCLRKATPRSLASCCSETSNEEHGREAAAHHLVAGAHGAAFRADLKQGSPPDAHSSCRAESSRPAGSIHQIWPIRSRSSSRPLLGITDAAAKDLSALRRVRQEPVRRKFRRSLREFGEICRDRPTAAGRMRQVTHFCASP